MSPAVFLDANVPIYASGREHPNKEPCARILMMAAERPLAFVTDAEVLQELLHRYLAIRRWALGKEVVRGFAEVMLDRIEPVHVEDIIEAAGLADQHQSIKRARPHPRGGDEPHRNQPHRLRRHGLRPLAGYNPARPC